MQNEIENNLKTCVIINYVLKWKSKYENIHLIYV